MADFQFAAVQPVGENADWAFFVGRLSGCERYLGYAVSREEPYLHLFANIHDGVTLGVSEVSLAIRLVGAIAQDAESGWGGIDTWFVAEDLRGHPDEFRCEVCQEIGCEGECEETTYDVEAFDADWEG